jgi:hypothetical protein
MAAELDCQRFCHVHQAGIAGAAAEIAGVPGVAAADVDDAAPARRLHERDDHAGTAQRSERLSPEEQGFKVWSHLQREQHTPSWSLANVAWEKLRVPAYR